MTPWAAARALPGWLSIALVLGCSQQAPDAAPAPERDPPEAAVEAGAYEYEHLDVFTDEPLTGNQLAVFLRPEGLTADQMMAITREMAFSETTFVFPAETPDTDFRVRIFGLNTGGELPVAGHPTPSEGGQIVSRQGVAMGRPSRVHIRIRSVGENITEVQVGGRAARVGRGSVRVR